MRDRHLERIVYHWDNLSYIDKKRILLYLSFHALMLKIILVIKNINVFFGRTNTLPAKAVPPVVPGAR